jgi:hypothetical protein
MNVGKGRQDAVLSEKVQKGVAHERTILQGERVGEAMSLIEFMEVRGDERRRRTSLSSVPVSVLVCPIYSPDEGNDLSVTVFLNQSKYTSFSSLMTS